MNRIDLIKSKTYIISQIRLRLLNLIGEYKDKKKLKDYQLALELGVSKGYVSQILNAESDHKISKIVDLALACNHVPLLFFVPMNDYLKTDFANKKFDLKEVNIRNNGWTGAYYTIIDYLKEYRRELSTTPTASWNGEGVNRKNLTDSQCLDIYNILGGPTMTDSSKISNVKELLSGDQFYRQTNISGKKWFEIFQYLKSATPPTEQMPEVEDVMNALLKQLHPMFHTNGYPCEAVPKATILSLPALMKETPIH